MYEQSLSSEFAAYVSPLLVKDPQHGGTFAAEFAGRSALPGLLAVLVFEGLVCPEIVESEHDWNTLLTVVSLTSSCLRLS